MIRNPWAVAVAVLAALADGACTLAVRRWASPPSAGGWAAGDGVSASIASADGAGASVVDPLDVAPPPLAAYREPIRAILPRAPRPRPRTI